MSTFVPNSLREDVCRLNRALPRHGLVTIHSGNASGFDPDTGKLVIKPSGVDYDLLAADMLAEVDLVTGESAGDATDSDYATIAYDAATGQTRWVRRLDSAFHGYGKVLTAPAITPRFSLSPQAPASATAPKPQNPPAAIFIRTVFKR